MEQVTEKATALKPWETLTDLEKREAIARRLGYSHPFGSAVIDPAIEDSSWPTNDGLAFEEVWPRLIGEIHDCRLWEDQGETNNGRLRKLQLPYDGNSSSVFYGFTWSEVICRAAYELLPEQK